MTNRRRLAIECLDERLTLTGQAFAEVGASTTEVSAASAIERMGVDPGDATRDDGPT